MKTTKDVENYLEINLGDCKSTLKECSKNDQGVSIVYNNKKAFNFDKISKKIFPSGLTSIDSICFRNKHIDFVEFKSGFLDKIDMNYNPSTYPCIDEEYFKLLTKVRKKEKKELTQNIQLKIVESLYVLKDIILPKCDDTSTEYDINFTLVFESGKINPLDEFEIGVENLANIKETRNKLFRSLRKYQGQDSNGNKIFFEKIDIISNLEFNNLAIYN